MHTSGPSVCLYLQIHQPYRLRPYTCFQVGKQHDYFDEKLNTDLLRRVANKSYLPTLDVLRQLSNRYGSNFRFGLSCSGVVLEQLLEVAPIVISKMKELVECGAVDFLGETFHHTLSSQFHTEHFLHDVRRHSECIAKLFGVSATVFRNTELIYSDLIGAFAADFGFSGILAEEPINNSKNVNIFKHPSKGIKIITRHRSISDEIAFKFLQSKYASVQEKAKDFISRVNEVSSSGNPAALFLDFETFGEHLCAETGIFEFLKTVADELIDSNKGRFLSPSDVVNSNVSLPVLESPIPYSWADEHKDLSAWMENSMQLKAYDQLYNLYRRTVKLRTNDDCAVHEILKDIERLMTSDHFYYMCTKGGPDGQVHSYFSPFETPYDAFIRYMNVIRDLEFRVSLLEDIAFSKSPERNSGFW